MHFSFSLLAAVAAVLQISTAGLVLESSREGDESERINFGDPAEPGQFPYACALHFNDGFICTCSILSERTVMTAAHCVVFDGVTQDASAFYAIADNSRSSPEIRIEFSRVTPHPEYDETRIVNDIALFQTSEPIPFNDEVGPVCIARANTTMNEYSEAVAMGWGSITPFRLVPIIPDILQFAEQRIVSNRRCGLFYGGVVEDEKICGTGPFRFPNFLSVWSGICSGDSGGPLVNLNEKECPVQIGIASYINAISGCGKGVPAVWTRVSSYNEWITATSGDVAIRSV